MLFVNLATAAGFEDYIDTSISPKENFFEHATSVSKGKCIANDAENALRERTTACILENSKKTDGNKLGNMFKSIMNEGSNVKTMIEINKTLREIDNLSKPSIRTIAEMIAKLNKLGVNGPISIAVKTNNDDSSQQLVYIAGDQDPLPDIRADKIKLLFDITATPINDKTITQIYLIAKQIGTIPRSRAHFVPVEAYKLMALNPDLWVPYFDIHELLTPLLDINRPNPNKVYINDPEIFSKVFNLNTFSFDDWKAYLKFRYLYEYADFLKLQFMNAKNSTTPPDKIREIVKKIDSIKDVDGFMEVNAELNKIGIDGILTIGKNSQGIFIRLGDALPLELIDIAPIITKAQNDGLFSKSFSIDDIFIPNQLIKQYGSDRTFFPNRVSDLNTEPGSIFWTPYFKIHNIPPTAVVYMNKDLDYKIKSLFNEATLARLKTYLKFRYLYTVFVGEEKQKLAVKLVAKSFGNDLYRLCFDEYVSRNEPEIRHIFDNILSAYKLTVKNSEWLTPKAKGLMDMKLSDVKMEIGYEYRKERAGFSSLPITTDDPLGNAIKLAEFNYNYDISQVGTSGIYRANWDTDSVPHYLHVKNLILLPLSSFMAPLFIEGDTIYNSGSIGWIIGHEMAHAIQDILLKENGNLTQIQVDALKKQYSMYHQNANTTYIEDIADTLGLDMARFAVFSRSLPMTNGMPVEKKFFYAFAQRLGLNSKCNANDPHSPDELRTNTVLRNQDIFYEVFDIQPGDKMYLEPEKRMVDFLEYHVSKRKP